MEAIVDDLVQHALTFASVLNTGKCTSHSNVVRLELSDHILPQAPCAETHAIAEVADPAPIVLAHVEVIVVAKFKARVTELAVTAVERFLGQLEVPLEIDRVLDLVELKYARSQGLFVAQAM